MFLAVNDATNCWKFVWGNLDGPDENEIYSMNGDIASLQLGSVPGPGSDKQIIIAAKGDFFNDSERNELLEPDHSPRRTHF